jgi:hypothetical protein
MNNTDIYMIFTIIWALIAYSTLKKAIPFIKTYKYLKKSGALLDGFVCAFEKNTFTRGVVPVIEYDFEGVRYKSKVIHDEFSPNFISKHKRKIKILVDVDNPTRIIVSSPITILESIFGLTITFGLLVLLLVMSIIN